MHNEPRQIPSSPSSSPPSSSSTSSWRPTPRSRSHSTSKPRMTSSPTASHGASSGRIRAPGSESATTTLRFRAPCRGLLSARCRWLGLEGRYCALLSLGMGSRLKGASWLVSFSSSGSCGGGIMRSGCGREIEEANFCLGSVKLELCLGCIMPTA